MTGDAADRTADERGNNVLAAGGIAGVLFLASQQTPAGFEFSVEIEDGQATNRLRVRFPFLRSAYRVTVERIADDDEAGV